MISNQFLLNLLRACSYCGSFWGATDLYCERCWQRLENATLRGQSQIQRSYPFPVQALFEWHNPEHELIKNLAYSLKGGWSQSLFLKLAIMLDWRWRAPAILIPAPDGGHAKAWGNAIREVTGFELINPLIGIERGKQKLKSKYERRNIQMQANLDLTNDPRHIIFVDDIVTTGATASAAFIAMGRPKKFSVCSIVCNPPVL